jgi:beta-glucanase (GH16 family)
MTVVSNVSTINISSNENLILSDDFFGATIDTNKWTTLFDNPNWTSATSASPSNISISNGIVHLKISKNAQLGKPYIGCGMDSDINKFQYGRVEVRAKFPPSNEGVVGYLLLWSPNSIRAEEIDFAEQNGYTANNITFNYHYLENNIPKEKGINLNIDITQYHTYTVDVKQDKIYWYVDETLENTYDNLSPNANWFFSTAIWAGNCTNSWGGCPSGTFPKYLDIDYVRIWKY